MSDKNRIGVELGLDGVETVRKQLKAVFGDVENTGKRVQKQLGAVFKDGKWVLEYKRQTSEAMKATVSVAKIVAHVREKQIAADEQYRKNLADVSKAEAMAAASSAAFAADSAAAAEKAKLSLKEVADSVKTTAGATKKAAASIRLKEALGRIQSQAKAAVSVAMPYFKRLASDIALAFRVARASIRLTSQSISLAVRTGIPALKLLTATTFTMSRSVLSLGAAISSKFLSTVQSAAERAKTALLSATAGISLGAGGVINRAVESARTAEEQAQYALSSGSNLKKFGEISFVTRVFGIDNNDLSGALSDLGQSVTQAANGDVGSGKIFERLGIAVRDARGNVRDAIDVFSELPDALRRIQSQTERATISKILLGEDNRKLASVLDLTNSQLRERRRLAYEAGAVVSPEQLARARRFNDSWRTLQETFHGLFLTVSHNVYPSLVILFDDVARWIRENRKAIADWIAGGFNRLIGIVRDLFNALTGNRDKVSRGWVLALADILTAVGRAASSVLGLFEKFGPTIGDSLGKGVVALRDFAAAFLVAFGSGQTALDLFGTNAKSDTSNRIVENVGKNGVQKTQARFAKKGERVLPFVVDEKTAGAAVGFAGALSSMQDRLSGVFGGVKAAIINDVIPAIQLLYAALRGDKVARQTVVDAMIDAVDRLLGRSGLVYDFWLQLTGRGAMIAGDSPLIQLRNAVDDIVKDRPILDGIWKILTARGDELPESHPLKRLAKALDYVMKGVKQAHRVLSTLWAPIEEKTKVNGVAAGIVGGIAMRYGGGAILGAAGRGIGAAGGAALGAAASPAGAVVALAAGLALAVTYGKELRQAFETVGKIIGVDMVGAFDRFEQQHPVLIDLAEKWGENVAFVIGKFSEFLLAVSDFAQWSLGYNPSPDQYRPNDPGASVIDQARVNISRPGQALDVTAGPSTPFKSLEQLRQDGLLKPTNAQIPVPKMSIPALPTRAEARVPTSDMRPVVLQINGNQSGTLYGPHDVVHALTRSIERSNRLSVAGK